MSRGTSAALDPQSPLRSGTPADLLHAAGIDAEHTAAAARKLIDNQPVTPRRRPR
ncbi:hypothetical protein [Kribbella sp. VKM Ac-2571]|uniref:hypothetical protein n=1 Tax=Kribbella sp. VKM Ac-2571 TaxID=2512222 RepID=UPI001414FF81|nr:hypothetical protein [Kribbella sp. VKM Ac-2571]